MPRQARIDYPGALQHVIARGIEKSSIFSDKKDKIEFCKRLSSLLQESSIVCYAWCVMDNHFHLLLQIGETSLAEFMKRLLTGYAVYYNKIHKRVGHLFQNRYKSIVCDKDAYLLSLVRYIHLNPVKTRLVEFNELDKYIWTGHRDILTGRLQILEREEILGYFSKKEKSAIKLYTEFVKEGLGLKEDYEGGGLIRSAGSLELVMRRGKDEKELYDDRILGDGTFVEDVLNNLEKEESSIKKIENLESLIEKIIKYYKIEKEEMLDSSVRNVREARAVFVYLGKRYFNKTITELGKMLRISQSPSSRPILRGKEL